MAFIPKSSSQRTQSIEPQKQAPLDKWKLSSQLQKAIRHGKEKEAVWAAEKLNELDPSYLRYRLAVISVEDIGAGSPDVVLEHLEPGWKKAEVEARGGFPVVLETVRQFVLARKDRTPCDMMYATRFLDECTKIHGPLEKMPWEKACAVAFDENEAWYARSLAAWRCAGTDARTPRTKILSEFPGNWEKWVEANKDQYGEKASRLMRVGEFQREHHHIFIGLALGANSQKDATDASDKIPSLPNIGPWLSAAIDKHTADGAKALDYLLNASIDGAQVLSSFGLSQAEQKDLLGRLWFWREGSLCDRKKMNNLASVIHPDNQKKALGPVPLETLDKYFGDQTLWQKAREKAVLLQKTSFRP